MRLEPTKIGGKLARKVKAADMNNIQAVIYLAKGARVVCTWSGWKKAGEVNGAQGTVCDIIKGEGQGLPTWPKWPELAEDTSGASGYVVTTARACPRPPCRFAPCFAGLPWTTHESISDSNCSTSFITSFNHHHHHTPCGECRYPEREEFRCHRIFERRIHRS